MLPPCLGSGDSPLPNLKPIIMAKPMLSQTKSLKVFLRERGIHNFSQFFQKTVKVGEKNVSFFTLVDDQGNKTNGLVASTIEGAVNTKEALGKDYEVSWFTTQDTDGKDQSIWLLHRHQSDGTAGKDEEIDFG